MHMDCMCIRSMLLLGQSPEGCLGIKRCQHWAHLQGLHGWQSCAREHLPPSCLVAASACHLAPFPLLLLLAHPLQRDATLVNGMTCQLHGMQQR